MVNNPKIADAKDDDMIKEAKGLWRAIYEVECYGVKDMTRLNAIIDQLKKRGYTVEEGRSVRFVKE